MSTKSPPDPSEAPMTPAGVRIIRERLGLTSARLAEILGVALRSVKRWETTATPEQISRGESTTIPAARVEQLRELERRTRLAVEQDVRELQIHADAGQRPPTVTTYENDKQYQQHDGGPWSASWHRAVVARAVEIYDQPVIIQYPTAED